MFLALRRFSWGRNWHRQEVLKNLESEIFSRTNCSETTSGNKGLLFEVFSRERLHRRPPRKKLPGSATPRLAWSFSEKTTSTAGQSFCPFSKYSREGVFGTKTSSRDYLENGKRWRSLSCEKLPQPLVNGKRWRSFSCEKLPQPLGKSVLCPLVCLLTLPLKVPARE